MKRLSLLLLAAATAFAADSLTGAWTVTGDVMGNPVNSTCTFKQDEAGKLTGTCTGASGEQAATGTVTDDKVTFQHGGEYQGQALTITYTGKLGADGLLKGSISVQPFDVGGEFTAKKSQ